MPTIEITPTESEQRAERQLHAASSDLLRAGRMFLADHEASGFFCAGLTAAYVAMRAAVTKAEGGLR